tara:strand:- start:1070 stop:1270 length:201 start_codon:yes stop_codon:yes gene_type:complete
MKVGDLVRWKENGELGVVIFFDAPFVVCLLAHDSSICTFIRDELEVQKNGQKMTYPFTPEPYILTT